MALSNKSNIKTFGEHLNDFRKYLIRSILFVALASIISFIYKEIIFDKIILAPKNPDFVTYHFMCYIGRKLGMSGLCIPDFKISLINIEIAGQFTTHLWVSLISGIIISFPYIVWELSRFIKPALYDYEKKYIGYFLFFISSLFIIGIIFGYYIISPMAIYFLGTYQVSPQVINNINLDSYITLISSSTFTTGILFEMPLLSYFLTKIGLLKPGFMKKYRRHAIVVILTAAAIITPSTDAVTLLLVSLPLYGLYELSIYVSARSKINEDTIRVTE